MQVGIRHKSIALTQYSNNRRQNFNLLHVICIILHLNTAPNCFPAHPYHGKHGHSSTGDVSSSTGDVGVYNYMCK